MFKDFSWKLLFHLISMVLILKDKVSEIVLGWYLGEKKTCPPLTTENQFLSKSAVELAELIRNGELTSTKLVQAVIDRMNEVKKIFFSYIGINSLILSIHQRFIFCFKIR